MKPEQPVDKPDVGATGAWMDGLKGRPGAGLAHGEGGRIRAALVPDARDAPKATWGDIVARAAAETAADPVVAQAGPPAQAGRPKPAEAANDPWPWRRFGWAAALVMGVGMFTLWAPAPSPDPALRGGVGAVQPGPQWLVQHPWESANALAAELHSLQAEVRMTREGDAVMLHIQARPDAVNAVNARLAVLETGLDANGRLQLAVRPVR